MNPNKKGIGRGVKQDSLDEYAIHKMLNILVTTWFEV